MKGNPSSASRVFNLCGLLTVALCSLGFLLVVAPSADAQSLFRPVGSMNAVRYFHTATLLGNGKVLIAGGVAQVTGGFASTNSAELYDPATGTFTPISSMTSPRDSHTATLLPTGKVLIAGGLLTAVNGNKTFLNSAELFDPATASFTAVAAMSSPRQLHTATVLGNGKVLIAGGDASSSNGTLNTAELFDPATGTFILLSNTMSALRSGHTTTLLPNGKVLFAGGYKLEGPFAIGTNTAELFDPASQSFTALAPATMTSVRYEHTATLLVNGKVLIAGGNTGSSTGIAVSNTAELFDPTSGTFAAITAPMTSPRTSHTATLLANGKVLIAGGYNGGVNVVPGSFTNTAELFDPASDIFASLLPNTMSSGRSLHTATLMTDGRVLIAGGYSGSAVLSTAELFDSASGTFTSLSPNTMASPRGHPSATLLPSGKVLIAGGESNPGYLNTAELFDAASNSFTLLPNVMTSAHVYHTATLLPNGKVLIGGGYTALFQPPTNTAELFDPVSGTFASLPSMTSARIEHTATLLPSGKVLITGGTSGSAYLNTAELFDPNSGTFRSLSPTMTTERHGHTATLLANGKVLIAGGNAGAASLPTDTAEIFDPITETFASLPNTMTLKVSYATATLLPSGKVLIAGGYDGTGYSDAAELFDPVSRAFTALPAMNSARYAHTAALLPNGKVLIAGGASTTSVPPTSTAELFDPALGTFASLLPSTMASGRLNHTATLLPSGKILIAGGFTGQINGNTNTAELFDPGLGFSDARRPVILSATDPLVMPASLVLSGSGFRGDSETSAGSPQSSATNYPVVQLMRIDNEQMFFPLSDSTMNWSDTTFSSETLGTTSTRLPVGRYRVTVFTNGIPSIQKVIDIEGSTVPFVPLTNVVSRKAHGDLAVFDIDLPITGPRGIECRSGGANGDYTIIFTFANTLTSVAGASVTSGTGTVSTSAIGGDAYQYIVNLTGVTNAQYLTVILANVNDSVGNFSSAVSASMGVLVGDVNASGVVTTGDTNLCKAQALRPVTKDNFRNDINTSGAITTGDVNLIKQNALSQLPP
jgi:hypothetical protein